MLLKPESHLYDLIKRDKVIEAREQIVDNDPYLWIYDEILNTPWREFKYPRTIRWTRDYFWLLTAKICWARHERNDNDLSAHNCPLRAHNITCLHWADFQRHPDWHIRFWTDMWAARVFATAYVLNELWYTVPLFFDNFSKIHRDMRAYDIWKMTGTIFDLDLYAHKNPETETFQRRISEEFQRKYIHPIKAEFEKFWCEEVLEQA